MNIKPVLLIVGGLLVFGIGVYVMLAGSGNTDASQIAATGGEQPRSCSSAVELGKKLDPLATGQIASFRGIDEPLDLTEISFVDREGNPKTIGDWKGQLVLFNLWATWCPPCREEMPWFEELQQAKGGERFQVLPVSIDLGDASKPLQFYEEEGLEDLPFMHDNTMEAFQILKKRAVALGMPTTLLVDDYGCAVGVLNGPAHWSSPDAMMFVDKAISMVFGDT